MTSSGTEPQAEPNDPYALAVRAITLGDLSTLEALLRDHPHLTTHVHDDQYTLMHHVAGSATLRHEHAPELARVLLRAGMNPDLRNDGFDTALHFAASLNHVGVVDVLLEAGARTDVVGSVDGGAAGGTPLAHALVYGCRQASERLAAARITPLNLRSAAALGRLDLVRTFFDDDGGLRPEAGTERVFYRPHDEFLEWGTSDDPQEILDEALVYAAMHDREDEIFEELLARGADINGMPYFASALHWAAGNDSRRLVDFLLARGADPNLLDRQYQATAWGWAEFGAHEEMTRHLLENAARHSLIAAVELGSIDSVRSRLDAGDDPNATHAGWPSPLGLACNECRDEIAKLLVARGGKLDLCSACRYGDLDRAQELLEGGGENPEDLTFLVGTAANYGQERIVDWLLSKGATLSLHDASALGRIDTLAAAVDAGADIESKDDAGRTLLHRAIAGERAEAVRWLLDRGASVDEPCDHATYGPRALHLAAMVGAEDSILEALITAGADINSGCNGGTPLDWAIRHGYAETERSLRGRGARTAKDLGDWPHNVEA